MTPLVRITVVLALACAAIGVACGSDRDADSANPNEARCCRTTVSDTLSSCSCRVGGFSGGCGGRETTTCTPRETGGTLVLGCCASPTYPAPGTTCTCYPDRPNGDPTRPCPRINDEQTVLVKRCASPPFDAGACGAITTTSLPKTFEECLSQGGSSYENAELGTTCLISWCQSKDAARFGECGRIGGGLISGADSCCKINYPTGDCPCLGNFCD